MSERVWALIAATVIAILAGLAIQQAGRAPDLAFDSLGSATVPYFTGIGLLVLVAMMMLEQFAPGRHTAEPGAATAVDPGNARDGPKTRWPVGVRSGIAFGGFLIYVAVLGRTDIPFWLASLVYIYLASRTLEGGSGRGRLASLVVSAVIAIGIEVVFTRFLLIDLP